MKKEELIAKIAEEALLSKKDVAEMLKAFEKVVVDAVAKGEKIVLPGFLTFERTHQKGREGKVPGTGKAYRTPDRYVPRVKAGKTFKDRVAGA